MEPTYNKWEMVVVLKKFYSLERWDKIVLIPQWKDFSFIKRIIWLPGETIRIENKKVSVCKNNICEILEEEYLNDDSNTINTCNVKEFVLKEWYFVLWDNRSKSTDSRCCFGLSCDQKNTYEVVKKEINWKIIHSYNIENAPSEKKVIEKKFKKELTNHVDTSLDNIIELTQSECLNKKEREDLLTDLLSIDYQNEKIGTEFLTSASLMIKEKCENINKH